MIACFFKSIGAVFKVDLLCINTVRNPFNFKVICACDLQLCTLKLFIACDISLVDRYLGQLDSVADCDVGIVACNNNSALCINVADLSYRLFVCCDNLAVLNSKVECCIQYSVDVAIFIDSIQYVSSVICSCCLFKSVGAVSKLDRSALTDH